MGLGHRLAQKESLTFQDLYGENLLLMKRGWSQVVDRLRDDVWKNPLLSLPYGTCMEKDETGEWIEIEDDETERS